MTGIIIVCMIHYNSAWFGVSIQRADVIVSSQVECNNRATGMGRYFAGTGSVMAYDMNNTSDRKQLVIRCGEEAKDCKR